MHSLTLNAEQFEEIHHAYLDNQILFTTPFEDWLGVRFKLLARCVRRRRRRRRRLPSLCQPLAAFFAPNLLVPIELKMATLPLNNRWKSLLSHEIRLHLFLLLTVHKGPINLIASAS